MKRSVAKNVLVTGYTNPDLDAYACAAAYAELLRLQGQPAQGACFGKPLSEVAFVLDLVSELQLTQFNPSDFDQFVIVDTSEARHIPSGINPKKVIEVIDHHLYNDPADFCNAKLDIQAVGAAATLVAERFQQAEITPRRKIAALLYAAIISNTLNFKASVTTDRDAAAAGWLLDYAKLQVDFARDLFAAKSDVSGEKLQELMNLEMNPCEVEGKLFNVGSLELVGVPAILAERQQEIHEILVSAHTKHKAHVTVFSMCDVELGKTYFITPYSDIQKILGEILAVEFSGNTAEYPSIILRKEYVQGLRQRYFEKSKETHRSLVSVSWMMPVAAALLVHPVIKLIFWARDLLG